MKLKKIELILLTFVLIVYGLLICQKINLVTLDLGRHLKNGEVILNSLSVPEANLYSYSNPEYPFLNHHWGSGVVFYLIEKIAGFTGISLFYLLISFLTLFVFFSIAKNISKFSIVILTALVCLPVISSRFEIRPESFSYLFAGIFWLILENVRLRKTKEKWLFILPVIMLLWVNLHIYFFLGFLLTGVYLLSYLRSLSHLRYLGITLLFSLLASLLNPAGFKGVLYPFQIFKGYGYRLFENQSVWFLDKIVNYPLNLYFKILFGVLVLSWIYVIVKKERMNIVNLVLSVFFSYLALTSVRNFTLFGFFSLPTIAQNFKSIFKSELKSAVGNYIQITLLTLLVLVLFLIKPTYWFGRIKVGLGTNPQTAKAAEFFLKNNFSGPIFNNYDNGGYLIYYLYPKEKVFVDNRPEAYPKDFFESIYVPMQEQKDKWEQMDQKYNFNCIFFYRHDLTPWSQTFLVEKIKDPLWAPVFVDNYQIIFLKRNEKNKELIKKFELPKEMFSVQEVS